MIDLNQNQQNVDKQQKIRFVCISDTHNRAHNLIIPQGDVLIHCGDFSNSGNTEEINQFCLFLQGLKDFKHKIIIAGNHDATLDLQNFEQKHKFTFKLENQNINAQQLKQLIKQNCTYLEDQCIQLYGYNIYGSPYTPLCFNQAFMLEQEEIMKKWKSIPDDIDILITHGPPKYILDKYKDGSHAGCPHLLQEIQSRIHPVYHIFGHMHGQYGIEKIGQTTFINACSVNYENQINQPIVLELPLKSK